MPVLISRCCHSRMEASTLKIDGIKKKYKCPICNEWHQPKMHKHWQSLVYRDLNRLLDNIHVQNLNKDIPVIIYAIKRWSEWIPMIHDEDVKRINIERRDAALKIAREFERIIEQQRWKSVDTNEWRKTLYQHLKTLST